jgi:hypothetical protein
MAKRDDLIAGLIAGKAPAIVALVRGPDAEIRAESAPWPGSESWSAAAVVDAMVLAKQSHAELVAAMVRASRDADEAIASMRRMADELGAAPQTVDQVIAAAAAEVDELEVQVKAWNATGGLSKINAAYKRYRTLCIATAATAVSYSDYLHAYKLKVADQVGRNLALGAPKFTGVLDIQPDPLPSIKTQR